MSCCLNSGVCESTNETFLRGLFMSVSDLDVFKIDFGCLISTMDFECLRIDFGIMVGVIV